MHTRDHTPDQMAGGKVFLLGLVCGAAVGAALGLLFAPKSGADLRHQMSDSAMRLKRRATDTYEHAAEAVTGAVERSRKAYEAGKEAFAEARAKEKDRKPTPVDMRVG